MKIKISITCACKMYGMKKNGTGAVTTAKN